ncbi:ABC transporter substrate-binding protein [Nesterenkonia populi]|uniref:ABC transporter substrate-binding protein n=1 Tax=Nesterenkonia populi TaxID=1591087 RepID=UPI0014790CC5|nr:ABC transporter substrate-binding protein [Nesterenkonia populi]
MKAAVATVSAASLLTLSACGDGGGNADHPEPDASIVVGVAPDFFFTHLYVAVQEDFFAAEGIEAELVEFPSGMEATEAITAGQADITSTTSSTLSLLAGSGSDVTALASNLVGDGWYGIVANEEAGDVSDSSDLEGLTLAAPHGSVLDMHVRNFLESHNLSAEDIDYEDVNAAQLVTGLTRGDFDAASMWEPNVSQSLAETEGSSVVLDSEETMPVTGYTVGGSDVVEDEELAVRVLTALDNAIDWIEENPDEVLDLVMENSGIDDESLAQTVQDKVSYRLDFSEEEVDEIYESRDFYESLGMTDATDDDVTQMYDTSTFEEWNSSGDS